MVIKLGQVSSVGSPLARERGSQANHLPWTQSLAPRSRGSASLAGPGGAERHRQSGADPRGGPQA